MGIHKAEMLFKVTLPISLLCTCFQLTCIQFRSSPQTLSKSCFSLSLASVWANNSYTESERETSHLLLLWTYHQGMLQPLIDTDSRSDWNNVLHGHNLWSTEEPWLDESCHLAPEKCWPEHQSIPMAFSIVSTEGKWWMDNCDPSIWEPGAIQYICTRLRRVVSLLCPFFSQMMWPSSEHLCH